MDYSTRSKDVDSRYEFRQDNSTVESLVQPVGDRQNPDNPYTTDSRRTGHHAYESTRRNGDNRQETDRRSNNPEYTKRVVPTAEVFVDRGRRPSHGNARTCVMEINITVGMGADRTPHFITNPSAIRSTAVIDDVRYVDLNFQAPENTAQLATDGIIRQSTSASRDSFGFQNKKTDE